MGHSGPGRATIHPAAPSNASGSSTKIADSIYPYTKPPWVGSLVTDLNMKCSQRIIRRHYGGLGYGCVRRGRATCRAVLAAPRGVSTKYHRRKETVRTRTKAIAIEA